jgi:hypothetical protein
MTDLLQFLFTVDRAPTNLKNSERPIDKSTIGAPSPESAPTAHDMPADGKHEPPYTAYGLELLKRNRPSNGTTEVSPAEENDPSHECDPQGFPRSDYSKSARNDYLYTYGLFVHLRQDARE